jgi:predicted NBD/HSP70 family sugar kinase
MTEPAGAPQRRRIRAYIAERMNLADMSSSLGCLRLIQARGPISQPEAARLLGITPGTCSLHFQRLEYEGLIVRAGEKAQARGRPATVWRIAHARNFLVSLVFDVPFLDVVVSDFAGNQVEAHRENLSGVASHAELARLLDRFLGEAGATAGRLGGQIRQVALLLPGLLHAGSGVVRRAVNLPVLEGFDAPRHIREHFGLPCYACSLGISYFLGETETLPPGTGAMVIYWNLGVGVICGVDQRILRLEPAAAAERGLMAEMGHVRIKKNGRPCRCGRKGCLEAYVGGRALIEQLQRAGVQTIEELIAASDRGDAEVMQAARRAARILGRHMAWAIQVSGVNRVIVTGLMAPVFDRVRDGFCEGLATVLCDDEIAALSPASSSDPDGRMQRGAFLLSRRLFFHPEEYPALPRSPLGLSGPKSKPKPADAISRGRPTNA